MRTKVEFRSDKFPAYLGEKEKINPNLWGQRLAEYLQIELSKLGVETEKEIGFEDWGCKVTFNRNPIPHLDRLSPLSGIYEWISVLR